MQVNIVAADHPVWHGTAKSVTIPASEGEMGILADHEPVLTVIKGGTVSVVDPAGERHAFEVSDGFISFDFNKLTVAVERGRDVSALKARYRIASSSARQRLCRRARTGRRLHPAGGALLRYLLGVIPHVNARRTPPFPPKYGLK